MIRTVGMLLRPLRASESASPLARPGLSATTAIDVTSPAFTDGGPIPQKHAGKGVGDNVSPALQWTGVPASAKQLVLFMDDIDVPLPKPLIHTIAVLEPGTTGLGEGEFRGYAGPRPIPGHGPHRYRFVLLALNRRAPDHVASAKRLLEVISGHVVARGALTGTYER